MKSMSTLLNMFVNGAIVIEHFKLIRTSGTVLVNFEYTNFWVVYT